MKFLENLERVLERVINKIFQFLPLSFFQTIRKWSSISLKLVFRHLIKTVKNASTYTNQWYIGLKKALKKTKKTVKNIYFNKELKEQKILHRTALYFKVLLFILWEGVLCIVDKVGLVKITLIISIIFLASLSKVFYFYVFQDGPPLDEDFLMKNPRSSYYKQYERFFYIRNIVVPIYIESVNSYKKLELDVVVLPSNKYIKEYFNKHPYLINNALNSTLELIIPTFPLTKEGKIVITDKIKREINNVIRSLQIKGDIQHVYVHYIFAG